MRKNLLFYSISFALLALVFMFLRSTYSKLDHYSELIRRRTTVIGIFESISHQINNAAIVTPELLKETHSVKNGDLFYADTESVLMELDSLKIKIKDSLNVKTALILDSLVRQEIGWLLRSNVPDSIRHHKSQRHISSFRKIDSLINSGINRTNYLLEYNKNELHTAYSSLVTWMIASIALAFVLIIYAVKGFLIQKSIAELKGKELEKSEKLYRHTLDNMIEGVQILDSNWKYIYVNDALTKYSTFSKKEMIGHTVMQIYPGIENSELFSKLLKTMKDKIPQHFESEFVFPNGTMKMFEMSVQPIEEGIFILSVDITERKKAEENKSLFSLIIDSSDDAIFSKDTDGKIMTWNKGAERIFGYKSEEIIGENISVLVPPHLTNEENKVLDKIRSGESVDHYETERIRKDGKVISVSITASPIKNSAGDIIGGSKILRDITQKKESERKIIKTNRLFAFLSAINQSIVHVKDSEQRLFDTACHIATDIGEFKTAWIGILNKENKLDYVSIKGDPGLTEELYNSYGNDFTSLPLSSTAIGKVISTGQYVVVNTISDNPYMTDWREKVLRHGVKSAIVFPLKRFGYVIGVFSLFSEHGNFFDRDEIALLDEAANDISFALENFQKERLRRDIEISHERSETKLKEAQAIARIGSWEVDMIHNVHYWSDELYKIFGVDVEKDAPSAELFLSFMHPDDRELAYSKMENILWLLEDASFEFRFIRRDGALRYASAVARFEFDNDKRPIRLFGILKDITAQKTAEEERERMLDDIVQRNKDLEQFAYIVSHNLRAPVANIIGLTQIIQEPDIEKEESLHMMSELSNTVQKLDDVIKDLNLILQIKREVSEQKERVIFSVLLEDIKVSIDNLLRKENVSITSDFSKANEMITLKSYMHSIFFNLISNSIKYRQPGIAPEITITSSRENNKIVLIFKDNGLGIDLAKRGDQVFGLYKRFHFKSAEGKGMGLFMVKTQVETLGGRIGIKSEENKGTEFRIEIEDIK